MNAAAGIPCPRCDPAFALPGPDKLARLAAEMSIDPSLAAEASVYAQRLETCGQCEALREKVLCFHCGCFVMFRARPVRSYCPHPAGDKWER